MLTRVHPVELMKDSPPRFAGVVESHDDSIHQRREFISWVQSGKSCALPDFIPPALERLLKRCWITKPSDRPTMKKVLLRLRHMQIKLRDGDEIWNKAERMFRQYQIHYGNEEEEKKMEDTEIGKDKEEDSLSMSPLSTSLLTPSTFVDTSSSMEKVDGESALRRALLSKVV